MAPASFAAPVCHSQHGVHVVEAVRSGVPVKGVCFCVDRNVFATCLHIVAHASSVRISGHAAHVHRVCPAADIALLRASTLSTIAYNFAQPPVPFAASVLGHTQAQRKLTARSIRTHLYPSGAYLPAFACAPSHAKLQWAGWSGAPLLHRGSVVGMVSQHSEPVVHAIHPRLLNTVTNAAERHVRMGAITPLTVQSLQAHAVRKAARIPSHVHGIRVAGNTARFGVRAGDVITAIDEHSIDDRGHVQWGVYRTGYHALLAEKRPGENVQLRMWNTEHGSHSISVTLTHADYATAALAYEPVRVVRAGRFVFMSLSLEYLSRWGERWSSECPQSLLQFAVTHSKQNVRPVVLAAVADPDAGEECAEVYHELLHLRVVGVNGHEVHQLTDMIRYTRDIQGDAVVEFENGFVLSIPRCIIERSSFDPVAESVLPW